RTTRHARPRPSTTSAVRRRRSRRSSFALRQVGEPDLDEWAHGVLEPGLARHRERLLPALARLLRVDALLEPVVARHEQLLNPMTSVVLTLHNATLTRHSCPPGSGDMAS